mmetsp:Transcript_30151/g.47266  ORF Transcript_30151/g.47266 Transcript_30151/m.47266 type:complete len:226 (+) Transcript_30151:68-745(+)
MRVKTAQQKDPQKAHLTTSQLPHFSHETSRKAPSPLRGRESSPSSQAGSHHLEIYRHDVSPPAHETLGLREDSSPLPGHHQHHRYNHQGRSKSPSPVARERSPHRVSPRPAQAHGRRSPSPQPAHRDSRFAPHGFIHSATNPRQDFEEKKALAHSDATMAAMQHRQADTYHRLEQEMHEHAMENASHYFDIRKSRQDHLTTRDHTGREMAAEFNVHLKQGHHDYM